MESLIDCLAKRFGDAPAVSEELAGNPTLRGLAARRSIRRYSDQPVDPALIRTLCALALCAPSKSDLQQRDIIIIEDPALRAAIGELFPNDHKIGHSPAFLVFCGNNRRQRLLHLWRGRPFPNDHLDPFFNAAVDAAIALATFVTAAEASGLGCCPISVIRNHVRAIADLLKLPDWVFPVAGLTLGWPADEGELSLRLPLAATVHSNRYGETGLQQAIETYDQRRADVQPFARQRFADRFGEAEDYGWSEDKARQYSVSERADFGAYVREIGFKLD